MRRTVLALVLAGAAAAAGFGVWSLAGGDGDGDSRPEGIAVIVAGRHVLVDRGATLARTVHALELDPEAGDLLDVHGEVLDERAYPGRLLLNGLAVPGSTPLRAGDRVTVVDGIDRREPVETDVVPTPAGRPPDPQFVLSRVPGEQVVARGSRSGKALFAYFRPTGEPVIEPVVALTFDDGPWPGSTPKILDILRRYHVRATFFTIGRQVESYPRLVRRAHELGMVVANHSYTHPYRTPFARLPERQIRRELDGGAEALHRVGVEAKLFRPPGGSYSDELVAMARERGMRVVLWSVDPADWTHGITRKQVVRRVLRAVEPGSIVLLHDGGGNRSATIRALPEIIEGIRKRGLRLVALS